MGGQCNVHDSAETLRIDDRQSTFSISDEDVVGGAIDPDVIGVVAEVDLPGRSVVRAAKNPNNSVARIRHIERVCRWHVAHALWLTQSADGMNELAAFQVEDSDAVIAELGHEEPLPLQVDGH